MATGYVENFSAGVQRCTPELLSHAVDTDRTMRPCRQIEEAIGKAARGEMDARQLDALTSRLKKGLPAIMPMGYPPDGQRRKDAVEDNGRCMLDLDHVENPRRLYEEKIAGKIGKLRIIWVHKTPKQHGLRVIFERPEGMDIPSAQRWAAAELGVDYDACCKDASRLSFLVPRSYFYYFDEDRFFAETPARPAAAKEEANPAAEEAKPQPAHAEAGGAAAEKTYPDTYHGTPYADICLRWLTLDDAEEPVEGERNARLFQLACDVAYITDFNEAWLLQVMPDYGLPEAEMKSLIHSACAKDRQPYMPVRLKRALRSSFWDFELPPLPERLPALIGLLTSNTPDFQKAAVAHAVFPALATYAYDVHFPYTDGKTTGLGMQCLLLADSSAGKGCVDDPIDHILADIAARDQENMRVEQEWKDEVNLKGANKDKRKRPKVCVQWVEPDMTNAALVQRLMDADGRFIYTRMDELRMMDALKGNTKTNSQFNIMCYAFDEAFYGQTRAGIQSVSGRPSLRFNWNASATIGEGRRYFRNNLVNGPLSRINLCTIPSQGIGADMPVYGAYDEDFDARLRPYIENLGRVTGPMECPEAFALAGRLNEECKLKAKELNSMAYDYYRKRAVVIAYRKACLLWLANGQQWEEEADDFIRWSLHYDLACKMRFFGEDTERAMSREKTYSGASADSGRRNKTLAKLPDEFTYDDLLRLRREEEGNVNPKNVRDQLRQWKTRGYISVTADSDTYRKRNCQL